MSKNKVWDIVETYVDMDYATLESFSNQIDSWKKEYGSNAMFEFQDDFDGFGRHIVLKAERLETDDEYNKRIVQEEYYREMTEKRDREEFERLKKKFNVEAR
jgi:hypothetical protein